MSKYTLTVKQLVENKVKIFDFDYPLVEKHKERLERNIINYFYFDEIGYETVGRFKQRLSVKMNLISEYYNAMYMSSELEQRILDNYDITETYDKETSDKSNLTSTGTTKNTGDSTTENNALNLSSDTPMQSVDINTNDYVSAIEKGKGSTTSNATQDTTSNGTNTGNSEGIEKWTRTMKGNIGVQTDADAILKYRETIIKIDNMIINELKEHFMFVY